MTQCSDVNLIRNHQTKALNMTLCNSPKTRYQNSHSVPLSVFHLAFLRIVK